MRARSFRKLSEDVMLALGKLDALTDVLASMPNGCTEKFADAEVSTLAFIARGIVHDVMYEPAKPWAAADGHRDVPAA